jgi:Fe(3+) dicitrate transport protein
MGIDYTIAEEVMAFAGVHRGFSPPGSNPETRPEASINYESGVRARHKGMELQVIGFLSDYSELLGSDMAAAGGMGSGDMFNGGKAIVKGAEVFLSLDALHGYSDNLRFPIVVSYTLTDARFGSSFNSTFSAWGQVLTGDRIPYIARHQVNVRMALEGRRGSVGLNVNHVGDMPSSTGPTADAQEYRIPAFTVLDANFRFRWTDRTEFFATVQNITGERYIVSLMPAGARPGMPRAIHGGISIRF